MTHNTEIPQHKENMAVVTNNDISQFFLFHGASYLKNMKQSSIIIFCKNRQIDYHVAQFDLFSFPGATIEHSV